MRQICKSCLQQNTMSPYRCKGDDENCEKVMGYDTGCDMGYETMRTKAANAFCKVKCPQNYEYCWMDSTDPPCKEFDAFLIELDKGLSYESKIGKKDTTASSEV